METKFSGVTSLYLKHEIARLKRDSSHAVLFNFHCQGKNSDPTWLEDFGVSVSGRHGRNSIDGVKYFERVLQDGRKYGAHEVLIPKKLILIRRVSVHPDLEKITLHEDLSKYTKPGTRELNGSEVLQVNERGEYWVVTTRGGRKRTRDTAEGCVVIQVNQGTGGGYGRASTGGADGGDGGLGDGGGVRGGGGGNSGEVGGPGFGGLGGGGGVGGGGGW